MINYWHIMKNQNQNSNILKTNITMMIITIMIRMDIMVVMIMLIHLCRGKCMMLKVSNSRKIKKLSRLL